MTEENQSYEDAEPVTPAEPTDAPDPPEQEAETAEAPPKQSEWSSEDEQEARLFGWKAPEEWQGEKPQGYIDNPQEYLDRVQRSRIFKTMQDKLQTQEQQAAETARRMEAMNKQALERQKAQFETEMQSITSQQRKAVEEADTDAWDRLERQRADLLKAQPTEPQSTQPPGPDPYVQQYINSDEGKWLHNPILRNTAYQLIQETPAALAMPPKEQIAYAEAEMRKMYPTYFPQGAQKQQATPPRQTVDPGGMAPPSSAQRSAFDKLPDDAKKQFKRFVAEGLFKDDKKDREEYANDYNAA